MACPTWIFPFAHGVSIMQGEMWFSLVQFLTTLQVLLLPILAKLVLWLEDQHALENLFSLLRVSLSFIVTPLI